MVGAGIAGTRFATEYDEILTPSSRLRRTDGRRETGLPVLGKTTVVGGELQMTSQTMIREIPVMSTPWSGRSTEAGLLQGDDPQ